MISRTAKLFRRASLSGHVTYLARLRREWDSGISHRAKAAIRRTLERMAGPRKEAE